MTASYDVLVLGGGPAGVATAIALSRLGRSVCVIERTDYRRPRAGESFGGELRPLFEQLGILDDLATLNPVPFRGVESSWGSSQLTGRASIFHPFGEGWHVDRLRFDLMLARCAERAGVVVRLGTGVCALSREDGLWRVRPAASEEVVGRFLVDASGRGAPAGSGHITGRRWLSADRMVAVLGTMQVPSPIEPVMVLEAVQDGWWYSVPQPSGLLLAVLMTDADLLPPRSQNSLTTYFFEHLNDSAHTAARTAGGTPAGPLWVSRADSGVLLPDRGLGWRAVGDAAMACDPLAGDGVVRALRSAIAAAPEIDRELTAHADGTTHPPGGDETPKLFQEYLDMRGRYYGVEARWRESRFWARRRPIDWATAPLFLHPQAVLGCEGDASADAISVAESLIPHQALRTLLNRLRRGAEPAHQALAFLRSLAPVGDRRLLTGVQYLIVSGCISVEHRG